MLWDSSSSLGADLDDSSFSRWDHDEVPAFPLPFSSMISPKMPQRQRTLERQEMIDLMMLSDTMASRDASRTATNEADQASASTPPADAEDDVDRPRQHMAPKLPRRHTSPIGGASNGDRAPRVAQMRFSYLVKAQQGSARRLVRESGNQRAPLRSGGFIDLKRNSTY